MASYKQAQPEPIRNLEFLEDGSQVSLDGSLGDFQPVGDLFIVRPVPNQHGNLLLAGGQVVQDKFPAGPGNFSAGFR